MRKHGHRAEITTRQFSVGIAEIEGIRRKETGATDGVLIPTEGLKDKIKHKRAIRFDPYLCGLIIRTGGEKRRYRHHPRRITNGDIIQINGSGKFSAKDWIIIDNRGNRERKMLLHGIHHHIGDGIRTTGENKSEREK